MVAQFGVGAIRKWRAQFGVGAIRKWRAQFGVGAIRKWRALFLIRVFVRKLVEAIVIDADKTIAAFRIEEIILILS